MPTVALGLLSGALLTLAFPKFGHPALAWVALVPWLAGLASTARRPERPRCTLVLGLSMGGAYFAGTLYWIPDVMVTFGGLHPLVAIPVGGLLVAYLALFPLLATWLVGRAMDRFGLSGLWWAPVAWVASEWLRGWVLTGFPWVVLGASQMAWPPLIQMASLFGVLGVSGHIVLFNVALARVVLRSPGAWKPFAAILALTISIGLWGQWRVASVDGWPRTDTLKVAFVQGNVPQDQKWDSGSRTEIFDRYLNLSRTAAARGARLILWPESATPFFFEEHFDGEALRGLARDTGTWLLFGSDQIERGPVPRYYNAAFLVGPDGRTAGVYRKQHLVPFGEYVPLRRLLFFVAPLVEAVADFSPGTEPAALEVDGHIVSAAICYEVIFSDLARRSVLEGAELLTTVTNDAWYGTTSAPWQHFDLAGVRAVEFGRYLVRAANTGVSGIFDPAGRVVASTALFETAVGVRDVPLLAERTVYSKIGDSFAWACAALCLVLVGGARGRRSG